MSPRSFSWPKLLLGAALTLVGSLSVHVVMLQVLHVPFPVEQVSPWAALLNAAASYGALLTVYQLARPKLGRYGFWQRALLIGALYAMLAETVRGALMNAVVTTAQGFSLLALLPKACYSRIKRLLPALRRVPGASDPSSRPARARLPRRGASGGIGQALGHVAPVHYVPPGGQVVGAAVLVVQVVGVLPHVEAKQYVLALRERAVLVGQG